MVVRLRKLPLEELPPILLAFSGILGIGPMAIYRLIEGSYVVAIIDALAVLGFAAIAWMVYVKRSVRKANVCMALVAIVTAVATVNLRGGAQVIWMHPACVALFYLLKPKEAAAASVLAIFAVMPAVLDGREIGQIAVVLTSLAVTISLSVAFAALTAEQRRELRATTLTDPLTGAGNRRALDNTLDAAIRQARAEGQLFYLIILDIDHFKSVNDVHGHTVGDAVLCHVAETIKLNIRPTDSCFRAGGEEFVVVAATSDQNQARNLAERLRLAISDKQPCTVALSDPLTVTASFGLALYTGSESRDALYKRADDALYAAKRGGRNRFHVSETPVDANAA